MQPVLEVVLPVPERNEDGHLLARHTVWGRILAALPHIWVFPLHPLHAHGSAELDKEPAHCRRKDSIIYASATAS